jgi:hypothetical protein
MPKSQERGSIQPKPQMSSWLNTRATLPFFFVIRQTLNRHFNAVNKLKATVNLKNKGKSNTSNVQQTLPNIGTY